MMYHDYHQTYQNLKSEQTDKVQHEIYPTCSFFIAKQVPLSVNNICIIDLLDLSLALDGVT